MINNFYSDDRCQAHFRFEAGNLRADSQTTNTLNDRNGVTADIRRDYRREGTASAFFDKSLNQYFIIPDANLSPFFPLRYGSVQRVLSLCFWVMFKSLDTPQCLVAKSISGQISFRYYTTGTSLFVDWGFNNGTSNRTFQVAPLTLVVNKWYHLCLAIVDSQHVLHTRVYKPHEESVLLNQVDIQIMDQLAVTEAPFTIGADGDGSNPFDGWMDELVIWNIEKSSLEFDAVRQFRYKQSLGNSFGDDLTCKGWYRFEEAPGFLADTTGQNDLVDCSYFFPIEEGAYRVNKIIPDTVRYKEDSQSAFFQSSINAYALIEDSDLSYAFPLKLGYFSKAMTLCFWVRLTDNIATERVLVCKAEDTTASCCFAIRLNANHFISFDWGYGDGIENFPITSLVTGRWYHFGVTIEGSEKFFACRIYDSVQQVKVADVYHTFSNELAMTDAPLTIGWQRGTSRYFDGWIDELVFFNETKVPSELDVIRAGRFSRNFRAARAQSSCIMVAGGTESKAQIETVALQAAYETTSLPYVFSIGVMIAFPRECYRARGWNNFYNDGDVRGVFQFESTPGFLQDTIRGQQFINVNNVTQVQSCVSVPLTAQIVEPFQALVEMPVLVFNETFQDSYSLQLEIVMPNLQVFENATIVSGDEFGTHNLIIDAPHAFVDLPI